MEEPLRKFSATSGNGYDLFQYFIKIIPTQYVSVYGDVISTNQYSATELTLGCDINKHYYKDGEQKYFSLAKLHIQY